MLQARFFSFKAMAVRNDYLNSIKNRNIMIENCVITIFYKKEVLC